VKLDALVPVIASIVGIYLIFRSGYLRAVLTAPFHRPARHRTVVVDTLELDFEARPLAAHNGRELEPHRHRAHLHS
jgi:hypothetical protein